MNEFNYRIGRAEVPFYNGNIMTIYKLYIFGDEKNNTWIQNYNLIGTTKLLNESFSRYMLFMDWYNIQTMLNIAKRNGALAFGMPKYLYNHLIKHLEDNIRRIKTELGISLAEMNRIEE